jgi:hypothetical protein
MAQVSVCGLTMAPRFCLLLIALWLTAMSFQLTAADFTQGREQAPFSSLGTGDYVWKPEVSPSGPVTIIVSVPEQTLYVYRNGVRIGRSTVSTGKPHHSTPTGVFTILEKEVHHRSNLYHGAPMPYMERVIWGRPDLAPAGPVTIIVSASNGAAFVYRNGVEIGRASITVPENDHIGIQVFTALDRTDADGHREWLAVAAVGDGSKVSVPDLAKRSSIPEGFLQKAREAVTAGTTLILSDLPVSPDTQSKPGFNILTASRQRGSVKSSSSAWSGPNIEPEAIR